MALLGWAGARLTAPAPSPAPAAGDARAEAPEPPPAEAARGAPAPPAVRDKLNDLHAEFIGLIPPDADSPVKVREALNGAGYRREYLIVLVPDPLDSTLANNFDFALDALRRAFAAQGYLPDRVYLPWLGDGAKEDRYRREPGILLFRRTAGTERRLATVLLVGERPKTGIHAPAFTAAVEMLRTRAVGTAGRPLFVLGPSFSGSAESLRLALQRLPDLDVEVVTGSATADGLEDTLEIAHADAGPTRRGAAGSVSFCRTVLPDSVLQEEARTFFAESLGWNLGRIALLIEEDTAYGGEAAKAGGGSKPLLVRFPSGLTEVRKLWETHRRQPESAPAAALPGVATEETVSELSLADPSAPADVGTEFDPLTPRTKELMIANLLESIPRYGVRYVGIVATDTRDKLYLTERMRGFAPGTVLFAFENHLVQAHPRFVRPLRPVLLVGNFPTTTDYRPRSARASATLRQFGSEFHQGIYRAAELLIGRLRGQRVDVGEPRVWITVSAKGTILPVASIAPAAPGARLCTPPPGAGGAPPPPRCGAGLPSLGAAGYLVAALAVGLLLALGFVLRWAVPPGAPRTATLLEALGTAALWLPAAALFLVAFYVPGFWREPCLQGTPWLVAGLWLAVLAPFAGLTALLYRSLASLPAAPGAGMAAGAILPLVLAAFLVVPLWPAALAGDDYLAFLHVRARQPLSGVSPLPPLLLLGLAAWTWARLEMQRLRQRARFEVDWPIHDASDPALAGCGELVRRVERRTTELLPRSRRFWAIVALALLLPVLSLLRAIQPIVEPRRYGWVFFLLALVPFLLASISFLRFVRIWRHLERLLDRFEQSELCAALAGIGKEVGWKPISSFSWRMPSFRLLVLSARKLKAVEAHSTVDLTGEGTVALDAVLADFFRAEEARNLKRELTARRKLRKAFDAAVARLDPAAGGEAVTAFLAVRVVAYLRYVFLHLRQSLVAALGTWLFVLAAVSSYAFEPKRWMNLGLWLALGAASILTMWTFVQMDRNAILSRIGEGEAGRVNFTRPFVVNALTYGLAPLIAVVLSIFPELGRHLGRWTDPLLRLVGD
ncbi:MAG TPA: hypothetical protein VGC93_18690 [Thermoanaerobaculia bacterium]